MRIAKATFRTGRSIVREGDAYPDDHPMVAEFPGNFCTPDEWAEQRQRRQPSFGPVEQATKAPGEKRHTRRPAK